MTKTIGYAAKHSFSSLKPLSFERRETGPNDVEIEIAYCGVCHSDLHQVKNDWKNTVYPCMPGHEIVGHVSSVGSEVSKFAVGDIVGVGCLVDSCRECESCKEGLEQYCEGPTG
ncbi:MAG: NAD(P)-dependent alcohol dehydrogenase, partial [Proteobacteria bacterium]